MPWAADHDKVLEKDAKEAADLEEEDNLSQKHKFATITPSSAPMPTHARKGAVSHTFLLLNAPRETPTPVVNRGRHLPYVQEDHLAHHRQEHGQDVSRGYRSRLVSPPRLPLGYPSQKQGRQHTDVVDGHGRQSKSLRHERNRIVIRRPNLQPDLRHC